MEKTPTHIEDIILAMEAELAQYEADSRWRHDWHERLGRGTDTEGRFYEHIEAEINDLKSCLDKPTHV